MYTLEIQRDFEECLQTCASELRLVPSTRQVGDALELVYQTVVAASTLGVFGGLWKVFQLFFEKQTRCSVKVVYEAEGGVRIEQHFTRLTLAEAEAIAKRHPPKTHVLVQLFRE